MQKLFAVYLKLNLTGHLVFYQVTIFRWILIFSRQENLLIMDIL